MLDRRFRRVWDREHLPALDAFDPGNDLHLDELACHLLERFRRHGDAEAFALLFELTGGRLEQVACRLLARLHQAVTPQELVDGLKRRLWVGEGATLLGGFLALSRSLMERQLREGSGQRDCRPVSVPHPARLQPSRPE